MFSVWNIAQRSYGFVLDDLLFRFSFYVCDFENNLGIAERIVIFFPWLGGGGGA